MESARGEPLQDTFGRVLPLALGVGSIDSWELGPSKSKPGVQNARVRCCDAGESETDSLALRSLCLAPASVGPLVIYISPRQLASINPL